MNPTVAIDGHWFGDENPYRGLNHVALANKFIKDFPLGSTLTSESLDEWFSNNIPGFYVPDVPKQHILWKGHLQERHEAKARLNKAGATTKVTTSFVLVSVGSGSDLYEVQRPQAAFASNSLARQVDSLVTTRRKVLTWIGQAIPKWELNEREVDAVRRLKRAIDGFARHTKVSADLLNNEYEEVSVVLERHLAKVGKSIPEEFKETPFTLDNDRSED